MDMDIDIDIDIAIFLTLARHATILSERRTSFAKDYVFAALHTQELEPGNNRYM